MRPICFAATAITILTLVAGPALAQRRREPRPFRPSDRVEWIEDVVYGTGGGRPLFLDIVRPRVVPEARMPALVYIHGGAFRAGTKTQGLERNAPFAERGYFTITIDYRLSGEAIFPAAVEDCKAAIRWLRASADRYHVDPDRIGVWGHSAGGHLAAFLATSGEATDLEGAGGHAGFSSRVACAVDCFGPTDFPRLAEHRAARTGNGNEAENDFIGGRIEDHLDLARRASPFHWVDPTDPPILILHGTEDPLVPFAQSVVFHEALRAAGVDSTFVHVVGAGHGFGGEEVDSRIRSFFARHLEGKNVEVSADPIPLR